MKIMHFNELRLSHLPMLAFTMGVLVACNDGGAGNEDAGVDGGGSPLPPVVSYDYEISGALYYVDAATGSDSNPGTQSEPFATILYALSQVTGGDGIIVRDGDYGDLEFGTDDQGPIEVVFTDWVTVKAADGHRPVLHHVSLGTLAPRGDVWGTIPYTQIGNSDLRLRLDGFVINDRVTLAGARYVDIRNSEIHTDIPLAELHTTEGCVTFMNGQHYLLLNNDISHCAVGVGGWTTDFALVGNDIHHGYHDGLKYYGGDNWLVQGNTFRELDDGVSDGEDDPDNKNTHVDGIHIHTVVHGDPEPVGDGWTLKWTGDGRNLVVRGNVFYHIESMAVMINANDSERGEWRDFVFENNVFGPANGRLFIQTANIFGFTFRHNTVLYAPGDVWTSMYGRTMHAEGLDDPGSAMYHVQTWDFGVGQPEPIPHDYYNNIMGGQSAGLTQTGGIVANNLFLTPELVGALPYEPIEGNIQDYIDDGGVLGALVNGGAAHNAGTADHEVPEADIYGTSRDETPDIGAVELP